MQEFVVTALSVHMPNVMRWAGGIARLLRQHQISLAGKGTGSAGTDALTLADLSLQEMIVAALRDCDPIFRHCSIDAEETTGDLHLFPDNAPLTIGIDPIDGTRKYRDHAGHGYSIMLHLRNKTEVVYSLVFIPELGPAGWWVEAVGDRIVCGPDDPGRRAEDVLRSLPAISVPAHPVSKTIYVNGFRSNEQEVVNRLRQAGLNGLMSDELPSCPYDLIAKGELAGVLLHSPNVYDFPVILHLMQIIGGQGVFVRDRHAVNFRDLWLDPKASMRRLRGIVACATNSADLQVLCDLSQDWHSDRYREGDQL